MSLSNDKKRLIQPFCAFSVMALMVCSSLVSVAAAIGAGNTFEHARAYSEAGAEDGRVAHAKTIVLDINGVRKNVLFAGKTVGELLRVTRTKIGANQIVSPSLTAGVTPFMTVTVRDAKTVVLTADGKTEKIKLACGKLTESLRMAGIPLSSEDILSVPRDSRVEDVDRLTIRRVSYRQTVTNETVPFGKKTESTKQLAAGVTKIKTAGKNGQKTVTKRVKTIDGVQSGAAAVSEVITKQPVDEVTLVGTKGAAGTFTDEAGKTVAYKQVFTGSGTAYTAEPGALTATGVAAYRGGVAVDPDRIPYGSKLYVVSADGSVVYGYCTAVDTGGALEDGSAIVDCFYDTYDECIQFGRRDVNVYVIT